MSDYRFIQTIKHTNTTYERPWKTTKYYDTEEVARNAMFEEFKRQMYRERGSFPFFKWEDAYAEYTKKGRYQYPYAFLFSLRFDSCSAYISDAEYTRTYSIEKVDAAKDAEKLAKANEGHGACILTGIGCIILWLYLIFADPGSMHIIKFFLYSVFLLAGVLLLTMGKTVTQEDIDNGRGVIE